MTTIKSVLLKTRRKRKEASVLLFLLSTKDKPTGRRYSRPHISSSSHTTMSVSEKSLKELFLGACRAGDEARVRAAITLEVDVNVVDSDNSTGLTWAIHNGHEIIMKILLEQLGIDINRVNTLGWFALSLACAHGHVWALAGLARRPGLQGLNKQAYQGKTPLRWAAFEGLGSVTPQHSSQATSPVSGS
jgi:ankyrin repeat protein